MSDAFWQQPAALPSGGGAAAQQQTKYVAPGQRRPAKQELPERPYPAGQRTPLASAWEWHLRKPQASTTTTQNYGDDVLPWQSVSSVEEFWTSYSHLHRPSDMPAGSEVMLFLKGVRPVWEDPTNAGGGVFSLQLPKDRSKDTVIDEAWEAVLLHSVGMQWKPAGQKIVGVAVKLRGEFDYVQLWTRSLTPSEQSMLQMEFTSLVNPGGIRGGQVVPYRPHAEPGRRRSGAAAGAPPAADAYWGNDYT